MAMAVSDKTLYGFRVNNIIPRTMGKPWAPVPPIMKILDAWNEDIAQFS